MGTAAPGVLEQFEASPAAHRTAQAWGGFFVGLGLGLTPGGAMMDAFLSTARAMDRGTRLAQVGKAIGEMLGGFYLTAGGFTGELLGTGLTTTGIGSVLGVPTMVVSVGLVTSGAGNMAAGLRGLSEALMSSGSGGEEQAAGGGGGTSPEVQKGLDLIEGSGAKVRVNPKTNGQEGNVTLDFGKGSRVNLRVETHPLKPGGPPVRHANVESVTEVGTKKLIRNKHITE